MSRPNGKEISSPEEVGQRENVVSPTMLGVSGNSPVPLKSPPGIGGETENQTQTASPLASQQTVRRSSRIVKTPVGFGNFMLSLRS